jgi:signal peptidase I
MDLKENTVGRENNEQEEDNVYDESTNQSLVDEKNVYEESTNQPLVDEKIVYEESTNQPLVEEEIVYEESLKHPLVEDENERISKSETLVDEEYRERRNLKVRSILLEGAIYLVLILLCIFVVPKYVVQRTIVKGDSMLETLNEKDNLLVNKLWFQFADPKRFDIVVFYPYGKDEENYFVKRVIGMPGEEVRIEGQTIYINDDPLDEDFGKDPINFAGIAEDPVLLGEDEYFLMGDNRSVSLDSRHHQVGAVKRHLIEGKAMIRIWPLNRFGVLR